MNFGYAGLPGKTWQISPACNPIYTGAQAVRVWMVFSEEEIAK